MKTKKLLLGAGFSLLGMLAHAQGGLEKIEVEKYYVANAADAAQADQEATDNGLPTGALPVGAVTYRFYADLLPGYKILSVYADAGKGQAVKFVTTGSFYNNPTGLFSPVPGTTKTAIKNNLLAIDTYLTLGAVATGTHGILKSEDNGALPNITSAGNIGGVLLNDEPAKMGIPLTTQDGILTAAGAVTPAFVGFSADATAAFTDGSVTSNTMELTEGNMYSTTGAVGPIAATNRVLIAQVTTTNGNLHYELNLFVQKGTDPGENYVAKNPAAGETVLPSLMGDLDPNGGSNVAPTVNITSPADNAPFTTGAAVAIAATAADTDGTIASVEFLVDGVSVSTDNTAPYEATYTALVGTHAIIAKATDDKGATGADTVSIVVSDAVNAKPTVDITSPANGATFNTGAAVAIAATAADTDGTVASVEFLVDGVSISTDNSAPYEATYTALVGNHTIIAKATDDKGATGSDTVSIVVNTPGNVNPTANITTPANGATFNTGAAVAIAATAADADGTVASVEFLVDGVSISTDNSAPYEATYTALVGNHTIIAKATDDKGATGSDTVSIVVNDVVNAKPTVDITSPANGATFNTGAAVAIAATAADTDGTVASVEFLVDGVSISTDNSAPYEATYTALVGNHTIIAKATDDKGATGSDTVSIVVNAPGNINPTVNITSPANNAPFTTGAAVAITATAADADGTVKSVEFLIDGISVGADSTAPYEATYTAVVGNHTIIAKATDDKGGNGLDTVSIIVNDGVNAKPTVDITSPANNAIYNVGDAVAIAATAADTDGTVKSVEFLIDGVSVSADSTSPYQATYTAVAGNHTIIAKATDDKGATGSDTVSIVVNTINNAKPTVNITTPSNGASFNTGASVAIAATAADADGTVASVEFLVDGVSINSDNTAPYEATYTAVAGFHTIIAKATDDKGAQGLDTVSISVVNPGGHNPYTVGTITGPCTDPSFCLPVVAVDTVKNVIGYDLVLHYDKTKVKPTGNITINNALINPAYASYVVNNDSVLGVINIASFLNAAAPADAGFNGVGELFCVEFTKNATLAAVDTASFSITDFQESYIIGVSPKLADAGKYINKKSTEFKGSLKFWTDNSPIKYDVANPSQYLITNIYGANATCVKSAAAPVQPDLNGKFTYNTVNGNAIQIERDILAATNVQPVINGFDAALGNKVLVNDASFIPTIYQIIALDVNADGVVSAGDISQINQRSVKTITEFKQKWNYSPNGTSNGQLSKDWLFVDSMLLATPAYKKSATYPANDGVGYSKAKVPVVPFCLQLPASNSTTCPVYEQSAYTGILLGDVNGNYDAIPADGQIKKVANAGTIYLNLDQATAGAGYIDIPVSFNASEKVVALDFATQFNEKALSFQAINANVSYLTDAMANVANDDQTLRFTSNSNQAYEADKNIISIRFNTLTGSVNSADLVNMVGYLNGNLANIEVKGNIAAGITTLAANNNVQVYPNPANDVLNIIASENAIVELTDLQGRQIVVATTVKANEKQVINTENIASGVYMLKVYNDNFVSTQRVVVNQK